MKTIKLLMIVALACLPLFTAMEADAAEFRNVGQAGANFLQIPADARGAALANSHVALVGGVSALTWNPAAIHRIGDNLPRTEALFSYNDWIIDTRLMTAGVTHRFNDRITLGLNAVSFGMDDMEITTEYQPNGTGEMFSAGNLATGGTFAMQLIDRFRFGIGAKWVHEYIWTTTSNTFAFDFGTVYQTGFYNTRIGMQIANFGGDLQLSGDAIDNRLEEERTRNIENNPREERLGEDYTLPQVFNVGLAVDPYRTERHRVTVTANVNDPSDNQTRASFGAEYGWNETVFLRGGLKAGYDDELFALGVGLKLPVSGVVSYFDYAYNHLDRLGGTHFFTYRVGL